MLNLRITATAFSVQYSLFDNRHSKQKYFMKHFTILSACFFLFSFTACEKDSPAPDPITGPTIKKLSKIEYDGGSYATIGYNSNGSISKVTNHQQYVGNADHTIFAFVYTGSVLSEIKGDDASKYIYTYANQQVVKTEVYAAGGNLVGYYAYTYQNGKLWRTDAYFRFPGEPIPANPTLRYENEYYPGGNLKKIVMYFRTTSTNTLDKTGEYVFNQYDDKQNTTVLFENNPFLPMDAIIPNNPLSELHYNKNGALEETVTHTYTYDTNGYPLTRKTTSKMTGAQETVENAKFYY
jgi:hypothetical protein